MYGHLKYEDKRQNIQRPIKKTLKLHIKRCKKHQIHRVIPRPTTAITEKPIIATPNPLIPIVRTAAEQGQTNIKNISLKVQIEIKLIVIILINDCIKSTKIIIK